MKAPTTNVEKPETNQEADVYFWQIREFVPERNRYEAVQFGSHVTKFTPNWCDGCKRAYKTTCICTPSPVPDQAGQPEE